METKLGFGFIGAGEIAVASAQGIQTSAHARLVRVVDTSGDLAADLARRHGGTPAASVEELLADPAVEAVYIATPHFLHRPLAVQAARAGKHVLVEKPMGVTPADARAILDACHAHGVACGVPFIVRYTPAYAEARRLVQAGTIGEVTGFHIVYRGDKPPSYWSGGYSGRAQSDWRQAWATAGGGVLIMNTIHDLDSVLWITGLQVAEVDGLYGTIASPAEVEDVALAILLCTGGAMGSIEAAASLPGGQGPGSPWVNRVYGKEGQILLPSPWSKAPLALFTRETGTWREIAPQPLDDARRQAIDDFSAAVLHRQPVPIAGEACLTASTIIHAVYEAARGRERVRIIQPS